MSIRTLTLVFAGVALLTAPTSAQSQNEAALSADEAECTITVEDMGPDGWAGWQRNYGNGYGDSFHLYNGRLDDKASVLEVTKFLDGSVVEATRWCFRIDGSLSTITIGTSSPDVADGSDGNYITREGRLQFSEAGEILSVRGWLSDSMGEVVGAIDSSAHRIARDCNLVDRRLDVAAAQGELESVLGTFEGEYPSYEADEFDWCAVAEVGP
ncbi:MAG TPA: hypothetical protein VIL30_13300 [Ramlibacter sp.]|jgi:hypothetical protein